LHASIVAYAAVDCCSIIMHYICDKYTIKKQMITASIYKFASGLHEESFCRPAVTADDAAAK